MYTWETITTVKTVSILIIFKSALCLLTTPPSCFPLTSLFISRDCAEFIDQIDKNWCFDSIEPSYPWTWNLSVSSVLSFLLSKFCSFPHTDLVPILLDLSLGFIFWVPVQMKLLCFLISNSTCSLLVVDHTLYGQLLKF